jgi:hypothetical protein
MGTSGMMSPLAGRGRPLARTTGWEFDVVLSGSGCEGPGGAREMGISGRVNVSWASIPRFLPFVMVYGVVGFAALDPGVFGIVQRDFQSVRIFRGFLLLDISYSCQRTC